MSSELRLAALLCSRVCHDLISPVSALNNGIEVLADDDDDEMREHALTLISMSGKQASAKLQFARLAYGASTTSGDSLDFGEVRQVIDTLFESGKVQVVWQVETHTVGRSFVKILANLILIAADCIPRGGSLTVQITDHDDRQTLKIVADGDRAKLNDDVGRALQDELEGDELNPRSIQPFLTGLLAREEGLQIQHQSEDNVVTFLVNAS